MMKEEIAGIKDRLSEVIELIKLMVVGNGKDIKLEKTKKEGEHDGHDKQAVLKAVCSASVGS